MGAKERLAQVAETLTEKLPLPPLISAPLKPLFRGWLEKVTEEQVREMLAEFRRTLDWVENGGGDNGGIDPPQ